MPPGDRTRAGNRFSAPDRAERLSTVLTDCWRTPLNSLNAKKQKPYKTAHYEYKKSLARVLLIKLAATEFTTTACKCFFKRAV